MAVDIAAKIYFSILELGGPDRVCFHESAYPPHPPERTPIGSKGRPRTCNGRPFFILNQKRSRHIAFWIGRSARPFARARCQLAATPALFLPLRSSKKRRCFRLATQPFLRTASAPAGKGPLARESISSTAELSSRESRIHRVSLGFDQVFAIGS